MDDVKHRTFKQNSKCHYSSSTPLAKFLSRPHASNNFNNIPEFFHPVLHLSFHNLSCIKKKQIKYLIKYL